jgi:hypothetical protein
VRLVAELAAASARDWCRSRGRRRRARRWRRRPKVELGFSDLEDLSPPAIEVVVGRAAVGLVMGGGAVAGAPSQSPAGGGQVKKKDGFKIW